MARQYVRDLVRQWAGGLAIPYHDTVSVEVNPTDPVWCTVEWGFSETDEIDFCANRLERGTFRLVTFGLAGQGDDAVILAAEAAAAVIMAQVDPAGALIVLRSHSPAEFMEGPWYAIEIEIDYEYSF